MQFHKIVVLSGTLVILVSFILAYWNRNTKSISSYFRRFYIYPLIVLLLSVNTILYIYVKPLALSTSILIEKIFFIFDFVFWVYIFYRLLGDESRGRKYLMILSVTTLTIALSLNPINLSPYISLGVLNICKCLFCLIYFFKLFSSPQTVVLKYDPIFWIVAGVFFYTTVSTPIYLTTAYLDPNTDTLRKILFPITNMAIIVMHLLFIKGQLCIIRHRRM